MDTNLLLRISIRILSVLLGLVFVIAGTSKLAGMEATVEAFTRFGYPIWFLYVVGFIEFVGGAGMVIQPVTRFAALLLFPIMLGAIGTHLLHDPIEAMLPSFVLLILIEIVAWFYWIREPQLRARAGRSVDA